MAKFTAAAVLAGAVAAAIAAAPAAAADRGDTPGPPQKDKPSVMETPGHKFTPARRGAPSASDMPVGWRNDALWARPGARGGGPYGPVPRPPQVGLN